MNQDTRKDRDLSRQRWPFALSWGLPIAIMVAANLLRRPLWLVTLMLAVPLAWMGIACGINALRCKRLHCILSSPILLAGSVLTSLVGFRQLDLGPDGLNIAVWGTLAGVALSFGAEKIWGPYLGARR